LGDRDFNSNSGGFILDFLNKKSIIPKGAAIFSIKTGAPIIPAFLIRGKGGKFTLKCYEPIRPPAETKPIPDEILKGLMEKYVKIIEKEIFLNPSQWIMFREFAV
jgi:KDO2-lipid IV(A) lauroyltransferase